MACVRLIKIEHVGAVKLVGMMRDRLVYKWGTEVLSLYPPLPRKQQYPEMLQNAEDPF